MAASDSLAFWTGLQRAQIHMLSAGERMKMTLRVTEVFRLKESAWRMVHRHADELANRSKRSLEAPAEPVGIL